MTLIAEKEMNEGFLKSVKETLQWLKEQKEKEYICIDCDHYFNDVYNSRQGNKCCPNCLSINYAPYRKSNKEPQA